MVSEKSSSRLVARARGVRGSVRVVRKRIFAGVAEDCWDLALRFSGLPPWMGQSDAVRPFSYMRERRLEPAEAWARASGIY